MRVLLQRVTRAAVRVAGTEISAIGPGLLLLVGVEGADGPEDVTWLATKILSLRIFEDQDGKMNRSILECGGDALVVSQFTLHARVRKGTRPSFERAARPEQAEPLYMALAENLAAGLGKRVPTGVFGAMMEVDLVNDGPVTIWIDSRNKE
jgi:D-aminoacyl-tRNA deacylase